MKRRLEMLAGVLLASALMLGGCVAQTDDEDDDDVTDGQGRSALVTEPVAGDASRAAATDTGTSEPLLMPALVMSDPQPQPWKPPPAPSAAEPSTPGTQQQQH